MTTHPLFNSLRRQNILFEKYIKDTSANPTRKNVHNLRVTLRRIRTVLWLIEQGTPRMSLGKLPSSLRKLGKVLGAQRELDVALNDATRYHLITKKLLSQRRSTKKKLIVKIDSKHRQKILKDLEIGLKKIRHTSELDLNPGLVRLRSKLRPWLRKQRISDAELHKLRVLVKKVRYALEALEASADPLGELQAYLGRGHDLKVLQQLTGKNPKVQKDMAAQYRRARKILQPALRFAIHQIEIPKIEHSKDLPKFGNVNFAHLRA